MYSRGEKERRIVLVEKPTRNAQSGAVSEKLRLLLIFSIHDNAIPSSSAAPFKKGEFCDSYATSKNSAALKQFFEEKLITFAFFSPSYVRSFGKELTGVLKTLTVGSEPVSNLYLEGPTMFNSYSMSECGFLVSLFHIDKPYDNCPVGRPTFDLKLKLGDYPADKVLDITGLLSGGRKENPAVEVDPEDLAYMIYTSGSTGKPKGVELRHIGICNYINPDEDSLFFHYVAQKLEKIVSVTTISFDIPITWCAASVMGGNIGWNPTTCPLNCTIPSSRWCWAARRSTIISGQSVIRAIACG